MDKLNRKALTVGEYNFYQECRFCLGKKLKDFIDFGYVPLAGGFLKSAHQMRKEKHYPFSVCICTSCGLVQGRYVVNKSILFEDYFYRSSAIGTLTSHFEVYADELAEIVKNPQDKFVVEIGSNDGVFLRPLAKLGFKVLGVDPAKNIVESLNQRETPTICAYFGQRAASKIVKTQGQADIIVTSNSFAHIDDMHDVMRGVVTLLKKNGMLCIENHYLGTLLKEFQYDMMYHEHMSYYSLLSLSSFFALYDMEVFDVKPIPMHAGSMRYYVQFKNAGGRKKSPELYSLLRKENRLKLADFNTFKSFAQKTDKARKALMEFITKEKTAGKRFVGYGASGRATMMMSYCGINSDHLDYVVDDAPAKLGSFMPGSHVPIRSSQILSDPKKRPDYCLLFAWSFAQEIMKKQKPYLKQGGKFIIPLPSLKIVKA